MTAERNSKILDARFGTDLVRIGDSAIPGAGHGTFARENIPCHTRLGEYAGIRINATVYNNAHINDVNSNKFLFGVNQNGRLSSYIDAETIPASNWTRWINGTRGPREEKFRINIEAYQYSGRIWFRTTRPVKKGEELIMSYGRDYWKHLMIYK